MKRILLMGNPNVGKSVIFSRLTGTKVIVSNYPGTTVEFTRGRLKIGGEEAEVIDVPGAYSLQPSSRAEEVAVQMVPSGDVIINVVDATNLERNLYLTLELLQCGKPVIVALNLWDEARHKGIQIDVAKLEALLGVPVVPTCGLSGEGISTLLARLGEARANTFPHDEADRWSHIGRIVGAVQTITHRHHHAAERLADLTLYPSTGIPLAVLIAYASFQLIRLVGEGLISHLLDPFFQGPWARLVLALSQALGPGSLAQRLLVGRVGAGEINYLEAMGLLTTGVYVEFGVVLPYVFAFYLVLGILEDVGYLPRLGVLVDTVIHRLGMHGLAIVPTLLGLGCNVPGALAARVFETRRQRFIVATLMAICVPCMAQTAMVVSLVGKYGARGLGIVFGTLFLLWVTLALLLKAFLPGEAPEIFVEIPPYRVPYYKAVAQKLWLRTRQLIAEAFPFVLLGVFLVNVLHELGATRLLSYALSPVLTKLLGLPPEAVVALLVGFLRKDVAVGMLAPLKLSFKQLVVAATTLAIYFPCAATFAVLLREFGVRDMAKAAALMAAVALAVGSLLNLLL
jgi:ferrous iron transport protein B